MSCLMILQKKKQYEKDLILLASIVESSEDAIFSNNLDGNVTSWNKGAEKLFGYSKGEMIGLSTEVLVPDDKKKDRHKILEYLKNGHGIRQLETKRQTKDGHMIDVAITASPIFDNTHTIVAIGKIVSDIGERKKNEQILQRMTEQLTKSNEALEEFAYIASHDLKAPLRGIKNLAEWISEDIKGETNEKTCRYLTLMRSRVDRMEQLLDGLLKYSRIGRANEKKSLVNIAHVIQNIIKVLAVPDGFTIDVKNSMPVIKTHQVPLEMVLRNLMNNAVKHHDRPTGVISISTVDQGDFIEFTVADDGPGIKPQYHNQIFNIFQTLGPKDDAKGSGMGLAFIKKTVENQGGRIFVISDPQKERGTTFVFTWPGRPDNRNT